MAKYTVEQLTTLAKNKYDACEKLIGDLSEAIRKSVDQNFDVNSPMLCFDLIIQACLLGAAVEDGTLEDAEKIFIENITNHGDVMMLVNDEMGKKFNDWRPLAWDEINRLDSQTQQNLAKTACVLVEPYATTFVDLFAKVDKIIYDVNVRQELYNNVGQLFVAVAGIDGDDVSSDVARNEGSYAFFLYDTLVEKKWKEVTGE